jgi:2-keto-3-deoxy-L-arabinonate dehydratase
VPVIVTTSHYSSAVCIERSVRAQAQGASMLMVMPPYHGATFRVPETQIYEFCVRLSDAVKIPIMIQDAPASGTQLTVALLARLAREIEQVSYPTSMNFRWRVLIWLLIGGIINYLDRASLSPTR